MQDKAGGIGFDVNSGVKSKRETRRVNDKEKLNSPSGGEGRGGEDMHL